MVTLSDLSQPSACRLGLVPRWYYQKINRMSKPDVNLNDLTAAERLQLIEEVWDSLSDDSWTIPLTEAQIAEIERRLAEYRRDGDPGQPWREVLDALEERR